jgi:peptidoglycan/LPS O-acetylase OafA/YrhL
VACAVCPACLATYAKIFSIVGVSFGLSERSHTLLLSTGFGLYICVAAWNYKKTGQRAALLIALSGSMLVVTGHFWGDSQAFEWAGVLVLLTGWLTEQLQQRALRTAQNR